MNDSDVNETALVTDLSQMIRIPSVNRFGGDDPDSPAEAAMANYFEERLEALGLEVDSQTVADGRRNVWGRLKGAGTGPTVLLAGHMDTVGVAGYDAPFEPTIKDGRIYGRGSCDMKAGLAAYLEVARILIASGEKLSGDLIIAGVIDEEHAMLGSTHFGRNGPKVDCAIVAEPTQLALCPAHKGQILMTLRTTGVSAHSSMPDKGVNAIYHMGAVLGALQNYAQTLSTRTPDPFCGTPSFSVGVIRGGDNACSVPDFCEIDIDRRTIPGETFDGVMAELNAVMKAAKLACPELNYSFETPFLNLPPLDTAQDAAVMQALQSACTQVRGHPSMVHVFPGSTDAPNFNCPTVICGAGDLAQCHSLNEYIEIEQIKDAVRIYLHTIKTLMTKIG
jgi:acetylornithine deacetylase